MAAVSLATAAPAAEVLFPQPLHLTRRIEDPLTKATVTIEEYCDGNQVVSVSGDKTVIADYAKQAITVIDRAAGTYSVARFDEVATVSAAVGNHVPSEPGRTAASEGVKQDRWTATKHGLRGFEAGHSVEQFEFVEDGQPGRKVAVGIDRGVNLSQEAVEVLIGAAYPNPRRDEHEPLLRAAGVHNSTPAIAADAASAIAADSAPRKPAYGLPVTQSFTYSDSGSEVTFRTTVTRIGAEVPPPELLIIPPAAKRVESSVAAIRRQLRELDRPSTSPQQP
jgi:hypothetical protein